MNVMIAAIMEAVSVKQFKKREFMRDGGYIPFMNCRLFEEINLKLLIKIISFKINHCYLLQL